MKQSVAIILLIVGMPSILLCSETETKHTVSSTMMIEQLPGLPFSTAQPSILPLFIFLDDQEASVGIITKGFLSALFLKIPVLFSGSLMHGLEHLETLDKLIEKTTGEDAKTLQALKTYIGTIKSSLFEYRNLPDQEAREALKKKLEPSLVLAPLLEKIYERMNRYDVDLAIIKELYDQSLLVIKAEEWLLKKINNNLFLLLPKDYISDIIKKRGSLFEKTKNFSPKELALGLKIDHMEDVNESWHTFFGSYKRPSGLATYFVPALDSIFITRAEYLKEIKAEQNDPTYEKSSFKPLLNEYAINVMPQWIIYCSGHGYIKKAVCQLSFEDFKKFLDFLDTKIITKILAYFSCYSMGTNADLVFRDFNKEVYKTFSYPIAASGLNDLPASQKRLRFAIPFPSFLSLPTFKDERPYLNIKQEYINIAPAFLGWIFFHSLVIDATDIKIDNTFISHLLPLTDIGEIPKTAIQLKLPGIPWFNPLNTKNFLSEQKFITIGKTLAKSRTKPLNVTEFFKIPDPSAILLYTTYVPFELILNLKTSSYAPPIVPMGPPSPYVLQKISSTTLRMSQILEPFLNLNDMDPEKGFIIKEIEAKSGFNDLPNILKNVVVTFGPTTGITYYYNGVEYLYTGSSPVQAPAEGKEFRAHITSQDFIDQHAALFNQNITKIEETLKKQLEKEKKTAAKTETSKATST